MHGWDLARAADRRSHRPADIARVRTRAEAFGDALRSPQAFGPEVAPPAGADDQARLLAFLGRNPSLEQASRARRFGTVERSDAAVVEGYSPHGVVSTPIIWKPLITARGFIVPGAQW